MNTLEISLNLRPSKQFLILMGVVIVGSLLICGYLPVLNLIKVSLMTAVFIYGGAQYWHYGLLKSRRSITELKLNEAGWQLRDQSGVFSAELIGDSTVTTHVCILRFMQPNQRKKRSCIICKDAVNPDEFRRLLVALHNVKLHGVTTQNAIT